MKPKEEEVKSESESEEEEEKLHVSEEVRELADKALVTSIKILAEI
jgi:hypothetical protein